MERTDEPQFKSLYSQISILKMASLVLLAVILILTLAVIVLAKTPPRVVVIDPKGPSYDTRDADDNTYQNMAIFSTRDFIENLHSNDAVFGPSARKKASWYMTPKLRKELSKSVDDSILLDKMILSGMRTRIRWIIPPRLVKWERPNSRIYGQFELANTNSVNITTTELHHIVVDGSFYGSTPERPSGFFITRFKYLTDEKDINQMINVIGNTK